MAITYSQSITGISSAERLYPSGQLLVDDATCGSLGLQQGTASTGLTTTAQKPDGSQQPYYLDSSRWMAMAGPLAGVPGYTNPGGVKGLAYIPGRINRHKTVA